MTRAVFAVIALLAVVASDGAAQTTTRRVGIGIGIEQTSPVTEDFAALLNVSPMVYVPVMVTGSLMVEPGIGYLRTRVESDDMSETWSGLQLGVAFLYAFDHTERGRIYAGPRVGVLRLSSESEFLGDDSELVRTDLILAGVLGGEFFLVEDFSLGGEGSLTWLKVGDPEVDGEDGDGSDASVIGIGGELRVRWYVH